ncbi:MAG: Mu P family protein [Candidimonas sp.]|nr:MAG: Mu P family protein [Candidimonas sp.]TAM23768.1 MAG: Mu P family protein [Candidimonas sp.]
MNTLSDLTLTSSGRDMSGWTKIRMTRGLERMVSDFDIEMTDGYSAFQHGLMIKPGDPCEIRLGGQLVITGYIDRVIPSIAAHRHAIRVTGRSKCEDLVDCGIDLLGSQISSASVLDVARLLSKPYGVTVNAADDSAKTTILRQQNVLFGETVFDVIERNCRFAGLLAYDRPDGSLLLSRVSDKNVGALDAQHVEQGWYEWSMDQRYSEYRAMAQSMSVLSDLGDGGGLIFKIPDPGVPRKRIHYIVAESNELSPLPDGSSIIQRRALWEAKRRLARSHILSLRVDTWLAPDGNLWEPNTQISVDPLALSGLKLEILKRPSNGWTIGEVTYLRDVDRGTTAILTLSLPDAYNVQPFNPYAQWADIQPGVPL